MYRERKVKEQIHCYFTKKLVHTKIYCTAIMAQGTKIPTIRALIKYKQSNMSYCVYCFPIFVVV